MHSKSNPWDYLLQNQYFLGENPKGPFAIMFEDPFVARVFLDKRNTFQKDEWRIILGQEVDLKWIETNLLGIGLFGGQENFLIYSPDEIPDDGKKLFLKKNCDLELLSNVFFVFEKPSSFFKSLQKSSVFKTLHITQPQFWEMRRLFDFFCEYFNLSLTFDESQIVFQTVEASSESYFRSLRPISISLNESMSSKERIQLIKLLISPNKLDLFELASHLSFKRWQKFFDLLLNAYGDFSSMRIGLQFLRNHLIKIFDPTYSANKTKLSKYDKEIQSAHTLWKESEVLKCLEGFNELEILAKKKSEELWPKLRQNSLQIYK